jgi:hypothetical protein
METLDISLEELRKQGQETGMLFTKLHDVNNQVLKEVLQKEA